MPYSERIADRSELGHNVQKDHIIAQAKLRDIRGENYDPDDDLTVLAETGANGPDGNAYPHTEKTFRDPQSDVSEIERLRDGGYRHFSTDIVDPSRQAAIRAGYPEEKVDTAVANQLGNVWDSGTTDEDRMTAEILADVDPEALELDLQDDPAGSPETDSDDDS